MNTDIDKRRYLSMKKLSALLLALLLALAVLIPAAAEDNTPNATAGYYYVYTENGKSLNVRDAPGGQAVGSLKYGTKVYCYYLDGGTGWALITYSYNKPGYGYGEYACYISNRYLVKSKPPANPADAFSYSDSKASSSNLADINKEFRSARKVTPYYVTVRPARVSGWVNLRWAPSLNAEIMATYKNNDRLLVINELTKWYQVEDPVTGNVGFINRPYVIK